MTTPTVRSVTYHTRAVPDFGDVTTFSVELSDGIQHAVDVKGDGLSMSDFAAVLTTMAQFLSEKADPSHG